MSDSRGSSPKTIPAIIGAILLAAVGGYFGIDLTGSGNDGGSKQDHGQEDTSGQSAAQDTCEMASLPEQARDTTEDILAGGPYDHPKNDNQRFGNYEGVLPEMPGDYYREYTVETPGEKSRGARRIITGGGSETDPDVWYYTDDHYESFCEIPDAEKEN